MFLVELSSWQFYLDKVLYARKTGDIEEIAGNGVRGDDITVEDAMVSRNVSKAAHKIKDFSNKEAENCVFWWTWNGTWILLAAIWYCLPSTWKTVCFWT